MPLLQHLHRKTDIATDWRIGIATNPPGRRVTFPSQVGRIAVVVVGKVGRIAVVVVDKAGRIAVVVVVLVEAGRIVPGVATVAVGAGLTMGEQSV